MDEVEEQTGIGEMLVDGDENEEEENDNEVAADAQVAEVNEDDDEQNDEVFGGDEQNEENSSTSLRTEPTTHPYWMGDGWVPRTASGNRKPPEQVRHELKEFLDATHHTQTAVLRAMGVNSNSYRKFMYRNYQQPWRATENATYWSAARMVRYTSILLHQKISHRLSARSAAPQPKPAND